MKIFIDDGSTNTKLAWIEEGKSKSFISPNSFKREWSVPFGDQPVCNYLLDGERYSFDPVSADAVKTTHARYQYDDVNVIAIHHALLKTGLLPQEIDVEVTLPLAEYIDENNQPNQHNINRKKENVKRRVARENGETFTIKNVRVMPESIPAGFNLVKNLDELDSLLIVDLGGTTLDVAQIRGKLSGISKTFGDPTIGVSIITNAVKSALSCANIRTSSYFADELIKHRHDSDYLKKRIPNESKLSLIMEAIRDKEMVLINRVKEAVSVFSGYTHVMIIGGGGEIIADAVKKVTGVSKDRFFFDKNSQLALANGLLAMGGYGE